MSLSAAAPLVACTVTRLVRTSTYLTGVSRALPAEAASSLRRAADRSFSAFSTTRACAPPASMAGIPAASVVATVRSAEVAPCTQAPAKYVPSAFRIRPARAPASASFTSRALA